MITEETSESPNRNFNKLLAIVYLIGAFLSLVIPFGYYLSSAWIYTHTGPAPAPGTVRVPNFDVLGTAGTLSCNLEQLWSLAFGLFLLGTVIWCSYKYKHIRRYRLGLSFVMLLAAYLDVFRLLLNQFFTWFLGGTY